MLKLLLCIVILFNGNVYDFALQSPTGTINISECQDKYILLVNTASGSQYAGQYAQLEQLYQEFKDSLVIIAIPSDDFGNEPLSDSILQDSIINAYNIHFPVAVKSHISGDGILPLYAWINTQCKNAGTRGAVAGDFEKFLIDKQGNFMGVVSPSVSPTSDEVRNVFLPPNQRHVLTEGH